MRRSLISTSFQSPRIEPIDAPGPSAATTSRSTSATPAWIAK
jgi:hypothetical protein